MGVCMCVVMFVRVTWLTVGWPRFLQPGPPFSQNMVSMCLFHTHTHTIHNAMQTHKREKNPVWLSHQAVLLKHTHTQTDTANVSALVHVFVKCVCVDVFGSICVCVNVCCVSVSDILGVKRISIQWWFWPFSRLSWCWWTSPVFFFFRHAITFSILSGL